MVRYSQPLGSALVKATCDSDSSWCCLGRFGIALNETNGKGDRRRKASGGTLRLAVAPNYIADDLSFSILANDNMGSMLVTELFAKCT